MSRYKYCEIGKAILNEDLTRLEEFILNGKIKDHPRIHDIKFKRSSIEPMFLLILNFIGRYGTVKVMQFFLDHGFIEKKNPYQDYDVICSFCFRFAFPEIFQDFDNNLQMLRFLVKKGFTTNWISLSILVDELKFLEMSNNSFALNSFALETIYLVLIAAESIPDRIQRRFYKFYKNPTNYFACTFDNVIVEWPMILYSYCFQYKNINPFFFLQNVSEEDNYLNIASSMYF